jgi:hypothetical protein
VFGVDPDELRRRMSAYRAAVTAALRQEYGEIFLATAALCALGALFALALGGRRARADDAGLPASAGIGRHTGHMSENILR